MRIVVDSILKQNEIIELLQSQSSPAFSYQGHQNNMRSQLIFEVSNAEEGTDIVSKVKGLIKSQDYGKTIYFRVTEEGKNW
ncbi:MAG: hypothetical protein II126_00955 [Erysipelotrichaceae bacterium]|nr:hypothetical protein [Erysipelotrichaceae bacterium]